MRAFQGLILTKNCRVKKRKSSRSSSKTKPPIDPMEELCIFNNDDCDTDTDCNSELTDDVSERHTAMDESIGLFDNLDRNWSHGEDGFWEQACFAALCAVFYEGKKDHPLPPPHRCVVTGLWSQVVLPFFLKDYPSKIPELVAQEIWNVLSLRLQYITEDKHNTVSLGHSVYNDYGLQLAENADTDQWKHGFASYLQKSLNGDQPHFVQLYASQVLVPYWLFLGRPIQAASLLHQPSFISKEWKYLSKQENALQITIRHIKLIELYLSQLSPSPLKWQEALGLYQGWHTLLQQEMELLFDYGSDSCSDASSSKRSGSSSKRSGSSSKRSSRRSHKSGLRSVKETDPVALLILGRSLYVLSVSLDSVLAELPGNDAAVNVLWKLQAEYLSEALQVLSHLEYKNTDEVKMSDLRYLLTAAAWIGMSTSCATIEEADMDSPVDLESLAYLCDSKKSFVGESDEIRCLSVAQALLDAVAPSKKKKTLQLIYLSLQADLNDALGRWLFYKHKYMEAKAPLDEAIKTRRQVLSSLKDTHSVTLFWWGSSPSNGEDEKDGTEQLCQQLCLHLDENDNQTQQMEIFLAQSMEYGALSLHACDMSMAAMSWLQEALILKSSSLGKMSLEIARLNSSMAVVHEDMMQWEAALSRYRECLRIKMYVIGQHNPDAWFSMKDELFHSILGTLGSMGTAYRMLGDYDNAIGCYWKIATMSKVNWEKLRKSTEDTSFWGFDGHRRMAADLRPMPLPLIVLDEERYSKPSSNSILDVTPQPWIRNNENFEEENAILSQAAQAYQIIISLFEDKTRDKNKKDTEESGHQTTSVSLAHCIPPEDVPLLLAASYSLGLVHVHFGDFRSAISSLEHSLNALWVLDPSSSESGSSSEDSSGEDESQGSRKTQRRKRVLNGVFGEEMESIQDEGVYHVLGICRAASGEHDQAIRFHLTALRCARRMYGVDSVRACEILCDAATSYWYLKEYDKANEFWSECLRVPSLISEEGGTEEELTAGNIKTDDANDLNRATILYNNVACLCALDKYSEVNAMYSLEEAKNIFEKNFEPSQPRVEIANCLFYMAAIKFHTHASPDTSLLDEATDDLNLASSIYQSLGYLKAENGSKDDLNSIVNDELNAHIQLLKANTFESSGKVHFALDMYSTALRSYGALKGTTWDSYSAYVYNTIGKLHAKMHNEKAALRAFENAFSLRRERLGSDHSAVGETLYHLAGIHDRICHVDIAIDMYHEALRIQCSTEGEDTATVATTLLMIASLHMKQGNAELALEKLHGALAIRQQRVQRIQNSSPRGTYFSGDISEDFIAISELLNDEHDNKRICHDILEKEEIGLAIVLHCAGNVHVKLGEYSRAKEYYEQSLHARRRHASREVYSTNDTTKVHVCDTFHNLGCIFELQKDFEQSLKYYATSLKIKYYMLKEDATTNNQDGNMYQELVIYSEEEVLDFRYLICTGSLSYATTLHRFGTVHHRNGSSTIALACLDSALRIQKHFVGIYHYTVAKTLVDMGSILRKMDGKNEAARRCYKDAYNIRKMRNHGGADVEHVLYHIGKLYDSDLKHRQASNYYYKAFRAYGRRYVRSIAKRVCRALLIQNSDTVLESELEDLFSTGTSLGVPSIEETDDKLAVHFTTVAKAIHDISRKKLKRDGINMDLDVDAPDCLISFQLYILGLVELITALSTKVITNARMNAEHAVTQLEEVGTENVKISPELITYKMLYLIQE